MYLTAQQAREMNEDSLKVFLNRKFQEGRYLDYKASYDKPTSHDGKREFLKDVTGMANAGGGTIIIGVEESSESDGLPGNVVGIDDPEGLTQIWENLSKSSIDPRVPGIFVQPVPLAGGKGVVVVYVPPSLRRPHMVILEKHRGFYIRHNRDTVPMSTDEIRHVVLSVEGAPDKAQAYLLARELDIRQSKMFNPCPVLLQAIPIVPLETEIEPLSTEIQFILRDLHDKILVGQTTLRSYVDPRPTLWGIEGGLSRITPTYLTEIHRNGCIQAIIYITQSKPDPSVAGDRWLASNFKPVFQSFLRLCEVLTDECQIASPYLIRAKWIGARGGYFVDLGQLGWSSGHLGPWDLDDLVLPDLVHQPGDPWQPLADRLYTYLCNAFGATG